MARKAIYLPIGKGTQVCLGTKNNSIYLLGELDKVNTVPSWKQDFWRKKKVWSRLVEEGEYAVVGNMQTTVVYPEENLMFLEVLYEN